MYLKNKDGNYQYMIKGKNGESIAHVPVVFTFTHAYSVTPLTSNLTTDKEGVVNLGKLKNITKVRNIFN